MTTSAEANPNMTENRVPETANASAGALPAPTEVELITAINEEMATINGELKLKIEELSRANSDLFNLIASTNVGVIFLDLLLQVKRFTPRATELFHLIENDIGRPFGHIAHRIRSGATGTRPLEMASQVCATQEQVEEVVQGDNDRWYILRLFPYRTLDNVVDGVVITFIDITDWQRAEHELQQRQQQHFQARLLDAVEQAVIATDLNGQITYWNRFAESLYGWPADAAVGRHILEVTSPATTQEQAATLMARLQRGASWSGEFLVQRRDASSFLALVTDSPIYDANGVLCGMVGVSLDITARKQAEEALRESEERYRALFTTMDEGFCVIEMIFDEEDQPLDYRFLEVNPAFHRFTGLEDAVGKTARQLVPTLETHWFEIYGHVARTGEARRFIEGSAAMGRWFEVYAFRFGGPESCCVALLFTNITERKQAEEALRASEAQLNAILYNIPASVYLLTPDHRYLLVNRVFEQENNITNAEIYGQSIYDRWPPAVAEALVANEQRALAAKAPITTEESAPRAGETHYYATIKAPLLNETGEPSAIIGISTDITERKRAEHNQQFLLTLDVQTRLLDDAAAIMATAAQHLGSYLDVAHCTFNEIALDSDQGVVLAHWRRSDHLPDLTGPYTPSSTMGDQIISDLAAGQSVLTTDVTTDPRTAARAARYAAIGVQSIVRVPFHLKGHWLAVLTVAAEQSRIWRQDEIHLLEDVNARIWPLVIKARAEAALHISEERLRLATEAGGVGIFDHDLITNQTEISELYADILGISPAAVVTRETWLACVHPEDRSLVTAIWEQSRATGVSYYYECRIVRPDGALVWIEVNALVAQDETGRGIRITGAIRDITERKQTALHQQFLLDLNAALRTVNDPTAIQQIVVERLGQYLGASRCRFNAIDPAADKAILLAAWSQPGLPPPTAVMPLSAYTPPDYIADAQAGRPLVIADATNDRYAERAQSILLAQGFPAMIRVPCLRNKAWVASLHVAQTTPRHWRADEVQLVESVVHHFWPLVEKARIEEALRRQEEFLRQIADNVPGLVGYLGADERYRFVNATFETWFQRPRQQIIGSTVHDLIGEEERVRLGAYRQQALAGETVSYETDFAYPDGVTRTVLGRYQPDTTTDGAVLGFYIFFMDITERKRAEEALRQSEETARQRLAELEAIYDTAPVGLCVLDRELRWVRINERLAEINGLPATAHIGRSVRQVLPNLAPTAEPLMRTILETNQPLLNVELQGETPAQPGVARTWLEHWFPLHDTDRSVIGINVVAEEITERRRQEHHQQFLSELGMNLRLLSDTDAILAQLVTHLGEYLQAAGCRVNEIDWRNDQFTLQKDWVAADAPWPLVRTPGVYPLTELAPPAVLAELQAGRTVVVANTMTDARTAPVADDYQTQQVNSFIGVPIFQQGQWRATLSIKGHRERHWRQDEIDLVETVAGQLASLLEKVRAEEALRQLNATLDLRVRERTAALELANQELARSNRDLEQFNYAVAHDLRSPLRGVHNLAQWISEDAAAVLPPPSKKHLVQLQGRVKRLEQMLDDMLAYARIGRVHYPVEEVDTHHLVDNLFELLAPPPGFTVAAVALPTLVTLRTPLEMVMLNLLSNAIKHHHQPEIGHVQVAARQVGEWIEFCISDNGPGIAPEYHERIFGMFQTLKPRDQVEGSGIGLALVKKTLESYGGRIWLESAGRQGTTFYFTWPKGVQDT